MKVIEDYFPQGLALGEAFIGREKEIEYLTKNIQSGHHSLLLAPRRYGKTSLVVNTLERLDLPYAKVNSYLAISASAIEKKILIAVEQLLRDIVGTPEKILHSVSAFLKGGNKKWNIGFKGLLGVEIIPENKDDYPENILTALKMIEYLLEKCHKRAVIFMDEIQEIHAIDGSKQIQAAIREFAQYSKRLVFVFSGSNRHLLRYMFDDSSMPLYELCDRIILKRIEVKYYKSYLNKVAEKTFKSQLPDDAFNKIIEITECHPKRIYNLCFSLWQKYEVDNKILNSKVVEQVWSDYLEQRLKDIQYHLHSLSSGQLKILTLIAVGAELEITGKEAQRKANMASSSIVQAVALLKEKDFIEQTDNGKWRVLDPLVRDILRKYEMGNLD